MYQESDYLKDYPEEEEELELPVREKPRFSGMPLLLIIQIVTCTLIVLAVLLFKMIGGESYEKFRAWYGSEVNQTVIATSDLSQYTHVLEQFGMDLTDKGPASSEPEASSSTGR